MDATIDLICRLILLAGQLWPQLSPQCRKFGYIFAIVLEKQKGLKFSKPDKKLTVTTGRMDSLITDLLY